MPEGASPECTRSGADGHGCVRGRRADKVGMGRKSAGWWRASLLAGVALAGCGGDGSAIGVQAEPIAGGQGQAQPTGVVGFLDLVSGNMADLCSGSLIAPN